MAEPQVAPSPSAIATNMDAAQIVLADYATRVGDAFRVKVSRRVSAASIAAESIAIFEEATIAQIMNPEPWLAAFAGGSPYYILRVVHMTDAAQDKPIAIFQIPAISGTPKMPDRKVMQSPEWKGPRACVYAAGDEVKPPSTNGVHREKPDPTAANSHGATPARSEGTDGGVGLLLVQLQQERERLADDRRKMDEDRHRTEMEVMRREAEADRKRADERLQAALARIESRETAPKTDPTVIITSVVTALGAILTPIIPLITSGRDAATKREEAQRERDAAREEKREERESKLMEKISSQSSETAKVISVFTDSLSQTARAMVQTVAMVGELRQPTEPEPGIMDVIKAGIGAWAEASARSAAQPQPTQHALPPAPMAGAPASQPAVTEAPSQGDEVPIPTILDEMAKAIGARTAPDDLAPDIVEVLGAPDFVEAIKSEGGLLSVLSKRLPQAWGSDPVNATYVRDLSQKIVVLAGQKGIAQEPLAALFK